MNIEELKKINAILENDGVIAFVTDTVWGLGCLPTSQKAVEKIYKIKQRDNKKPLILMSNDYKNLSSYVKPLSMYERELIKNFFPGALTLVVNKSENTPDFITSELETVGIRVPKNKTFAEICKNINGHVLATTSANLSNEPPALTFEETVKFVGDKVDFVIDSYGNESKGLASTVASVLPNGKITVFRQGDIKLSNFQHRL